MSLTFGVSSSMEEAWGRVVGRLKGDASFHRKWSGGEFLFIRTDVGIHVPAVGSDQSITFYEL